MVWLALCVLFQFTLLTQHAVAMASGAEVCSASGAKRVDADGKPMSDAARHGNDCGCCGVSLAAPPADMAVRGPMAVKTSPAALLAAGRLGAQWLAALSRGPPGTQLS
ncbi:MAG TPA: DUF2946 family protein [Rhizobacter sp.]|nr:DUF2946 family protein [Rhizobacter sp.]